jgi:hypothetical protein
MVDAADGNAGGAHRAAEIPQAAEVRNVEDEDRVGAGDFLRGAVAAVGAVGDEEVEPFGDG